MGWFTKTDIYRMWMTCDNCGLETTVEIPRGTTIDEYVQDGKCVCSYCGCSIKRTTARAIVEDIEEYNEEH